MEYRESIDEGFKLYDEIENEIRLAKRISDSFVDVEYAEDVLTIDADWKEKPCEAKIEIRRDEIFRKVIEDRVKPKEAICQLIKDKICMSAKKYDI